MDWLGEFPADLKMPSTNAGDNPNMALQYGIEGARVDALMADPSQANTVIHATMLKALILGYGVRFWKQGRAIKRSSLEVLVLTYSGH